MNVSESDIYRFISNYFIRRNGASQNVILLDEQWISNLKDDPISNQFFRSELPVLAIYSSDNCDDSISYLTTRGLLITDRKSFNHILYGEVADIRLTRYADKDGINRPAMRISTANRGEVIIRCDDVNSLNVIWSIVINRVRASRREDT